jgi:squalene-hopene/tetraprenyl-beta-curcumene cyclase
MSTVSAQPVRPSIRPSAPAESLPERARNALKDGVESLLGKLRSDRAPASAPHGLHWCAELEGDSILSSEYLLMKLILGQENDEDVWNDNGEGGPGSSPASGEPMGLPKKVGRQTLDRIANHLRLVQREDGTWGQYPGSPADPSACAKAYLALKAFGDSPEAPHMRKAREALLALGGAEKCNTFSTFYLACLGCVSWDACPAIPTEIVLLPRWFPFHMDKVAAWTRTMILPLAICSALRPVRTLRNPDGSVLNIDELFVDQRWKHRLSKEWKRDDPINWSNFFLLCDYALKAVQKAGLMPLRKKSIKLAAEWILDRVRPETTEGLGAIFPPMVYLQIAFNALGYKRDHLVLQKAERDLDDFMIAEPNDDPKLDHVRLQPCFSPVWDTGIALYALTEAGLTAANDERIARVCDWLIARQVKMTGDWVRNLRPEDRHIRLGENGDAAAWAFEYHNDWYPDVDDTVMVCKAMMRASGMYDVRCSMYDASDARTSHIAHRTSNDPRLALYANTAAKAFRWLTAMQNDDGGWAAFDKTTHREWMEAVPFADHNAMQDPSCADITGRAIESLITCGMPHSHPSILKAVKYLIAKQEPEGCWWGRWGCNYIYGTWQALGGLTYAGLPKDHPSITRAIAWVKSIQNEDGGFGETANSYLDRRLMGRLPLGTATLRVASADPQNTTRSVVVPRTRTQPPTHGSTASQTAWGLACLLYACDVTDPAIERAVAWLCDHQLYEDKPAFTPSSCTGVGITDASSEDLAPTDFVTEKAGAWSEHYFTGTGFPKVFYLRYNMYRHYFPVMSLARYVNMCRSAHAGSL